VDIVTSAGPAGRAEPDHDSEGYTDIENIAISVASDCKEHIEGGCRRSFGPFPG